MTQFRRTADGQVVPMTEAEIAAMQPSLADRRERCAQATEAEFDARVMRFPYDFGPSYGTLHLQNRGVDDRTNWLVLRTTANELIAAGMGESAILGIRTEENITVPVTAQQATQVMSALAAWGGQMLAHSWALKDAIRVSDDPESIDIEAGWPG